MNSRRTAFAFALLLTASAPSFAGPRESAEARLVFDLVNENRRDAGLPDLGWNAQLAQAAEDYAAVMATYDSLSHTLNGTNPLQRARDAGYMGPAADIAENIAWWSTFDAESVVNNDTNGWMHYWSRRPDGTLAQNHRANILNSRKNDGAVGVAAAASGRVYYCLLLGYSDRPIEYPSDGSWVSVDTVTIVNETGRTLRYYFHNPDHPFGGSATAPRYFELEPDASHTHYIEVGTVTLGADDVDGVDLDGETTVQHGRTHVARLSSGAMSRGPDGRVYESWTVEWTVR